MNPKMQHILSRSTVHYCIAILLYPLSHPLDLSLPRSFTSRNIEICMECDYKTYRYRYRYLQKGTLSGFGKYLPPPLSQTSSLSFPPDSTTLTEYHAATARRTHTHQKEKTRSPRSASRAILLDDRRESTI